MEIICHKVSCNILRLAIVWERLIGICRNILNSILAEFKVHKLTHESLVTFMAEITSIVNSRPLVPVSSDPECPFNLSPNTLLTQKSPVLFEDSTPLDSRDSLTIQWKRVQHLSNLFWSRWRKEYLPLLQPRKKWSQDERNVRVGDIVIMKDVSLKRNSWPIGKVIKCDPSSDSLVRKVDVMLGSSLKIFSRPIHELIVIVPNEN